LLGLRRRRAAAGAQDGIERVDAHEPQHAEHHDDADDPETAAAGPTHRDRDAPATQPAHVAAQPTTALAAPIFDVRTALTPLPLHPESPWDQPSNSTANHGVTANLTRWSRKATVTFAVVIATSRPDGI
jgi:hypothetical protein